MKNLNLELWTNLNLLYMDAKVKYMPKLIDVVKSCEASGQIQEISPTSTRISFSTIMEESDYEELEQQLRKVIREFEGGE